MAMGIYIMVTSDEIHFLSSLAKSSQTRTNSW